MRRGECYVCALSQSVRVYSNKPDRAVNHDGRCGALARCSISTQVAAEKCSARRDRAAARRAAARF